MNQVGVPPMKASQAKSWRKNLLENQLMFQERLTKHKGEMKEEVEKAVIRNFGDKIKMIEALYKRTLVIQKIFLKKGLVTREEIGKEYEELKKKKKG